MSNIRYSMFEGIRPFGVEIETSRNLDQEEIGRIIASTTSRRVRCCEFSLAKSNRSWHVKTDGSCGSGGEDYGWEIASYKGSGVDDMIDMGRAAERLYWHGLRTNAYCGLHVHCEIADFSPSRVGYLLARWHAVEPWLFKAVPFRRSTSPYCSPLRRLLPLNQNKVYSPFDLWEHFKPNYKVYGDQDYRRVSLNLCNYYQEMFKKRKLKSTVELRMPEGTLRGEDVKNWIRFFVHMVETASSDTELCALNAPTLDDFFNAAGFGHGNGFSVLSPGLRETKLWMLKRLRKYALPGRKKDIDFQLHRMTWPEKLSL